MMDEQSETVPAPFEQTSGDTDYSGKLATSLFVAVIALLLVLVYAIASAA